VAPCDAGRAPAVRGEVCHQAGTLRRCIWFTRNVVYCRARRIVGPTATGESSAPALPMFSQAWVLPPALRPSPPAQSVPQAGSGGQPEGGHERLTRDATTASGHPGQELRVGHQQPGAGPVRCVRDRTGKRRPRLAQASQVGAPACAPTPTRIEPPRAAYWRLTGALLAAYRRLTGGCAALGCAARRGRLVQKVGSEDVEEFLDSGQVPARNVDLAIESRHAVIWRLNCQSARPFLARGARDGAFRPGGD
jgi:hypothetical protein